MTDAEPPSRCVFLTDGTGTVQAWNDGCAALFGMTGEQVLGRPIMTLFTPAGRDAWSAGWSALTCRPEGAEVHVDLCACERVLEGTLTLAPQYDADGKSRGCAVAVATGRERGGTEAERVARTPLSAVVDMFPGTFYAINREGRFVLWNHNLERVTELTPDELGATRALDLLDLDARPAVAAAMEQIFTKGEEVKLEVDYVSRSGHDIPMLLCGTRLRCNGGEYLFGVGVDITERRMHEQQLRLRERALHAASNGIVITRLDNDQSLIEYVNPAFERITGYRADEIMGMDPRFMAAPGMDLIERAQLREAIAARVGAKVVLRNLRKDGELFWNDLSITPVQDEHGVVTHYIGVLTDVTATMLRTAHLEHEVNHDALTGLANRNLLWDRLEQALHLAQRHKSLVATVLIDLDNFKMINDTFGHEAGDVVLKVVARRLQASVRDSDTVARMSGDEFVLILANQPSLRFTLRMVERLRQSFAIPVAFNNREIPVGASVGVSLYPHDGGTAAELVRAADLAMYHGKGTGRNDVHFFSADMKSTTEAKHRIELALRDALDKDELFLLYQPRVTFDGNRVAGFEALLRWRHPDQGVLAPARFLAEAEDSGVIVPIGQRVLDQACAFAAQLCSAGFENIPVTVNVSYREYSQPGFLACLADRLTRHRLPPRSLQLDLRIDGLIRNPTLGKELAEQLRTLGVDLSVDGFGAGLCDLGYLQQLAASQVKLASHTVQALTDGGQAVAKSLIDIGHNLNMEVVAEAVETRPQLDFLESHGCDQFQGIWFSEPLAAEAAQRMLEEQQPA
ncbi:sensor domain-containing protein [Massilia putida]|uniref:sensor domain-containing protein n=1 Tax=Massilia putida TaxID=1141883 RepID=UPI000951B608|nr:EAL domain-containing protein [Massilia putida]